MILVFGLLRTFYAYSARCKVDRQIVSLFWLKRWNGTGSSWIVEVDCGENIYCVAIDIVLKWMFVVVRNFLF